MKLSRREFVGAAAGTLAAAALGGADVLSGGWKRGPAVTLFNRKSLDGWYTFLRTKGTNSDPDGIFKVEDGVLHVLGQEFGYVSTNGEYDDFHLTVEFKWGEKKFPPREKAKRDSGILYRFPAGMEDRIWPHSIECQIQEGDCGDFWLVNGTSILAGGQTQTRYFQKKRDAEKRHGKWNRIEVVAAGDRCVHVVNGAVVNEGTGASVPKGKIVLQSEGAEVFYRKVELRPLVKR
jgi:hypothetical protein